MWPELINWSPGLSHPSPICPLPPDSAMTFFLDRDDLASFYDELITDFQCLDGLLPTRSAMQWWAICDRSRSGPKQLSALAAAI